MKDCRNSMTTLLIWYSTKVHWIVIFAVMVVPLHPCCLLCEVYRSLRADNGVYIVISFHELDFLLPLLRDSPGAEWIVEHTTMERKVEQLKVSKHNSCISTTKPADSVYNNSTAVSSTPSSSSSCSLLHKKPLNVFLARRYRKDCDVKDSINHELNFDDVSDYVVSTTAALVDGRTNACVETGL